MAHLAWMWCFWDDLKIPGNVSPEGQMGASFVANNATWLGLVLVEIHLEMTMRPAYVLQQYGWISAWAVIATHQTLTAILWNLGCWLPGLAVELIFGVNNEWIWIALSVPCIYAVMMLEEMLLHRRMRLFVSAFSDEDERRRSLDFNAKRPSSDSLSGVNYEGNPVASEGAAGGGAMAAVP